MVGGPELISRVDNEGYGFLRDEYGIDISKGEVKESIEDPFAQAVRGNK